MISLCFQSSLASGILQLAYSTNSATRQLGNLFRFLVSTSFCAALCPACIINTCSEAAFVIRFGCPGRIVSAVGSRHQQSKLWPLADCTAKTLRPVKVLRTSQCIKLAIGQLSQLTYAVRLMLLCNRWTVTRLALGVMPKPCRSACELVLQQNPSHSQQPQGLTQSSRCWQPTPRRDAGPATVSLQLPANGSVQFSPLGHCNAKSISPSTQACSRTHISKI